MTNHPNRSRAGSAASNPDPEQIKAAREAAGLTQADAAALVHSNIRSWQQWEAAENTPGHRRMHPAFWELFLIKADHEKS